MELCCVSEFFAADRLNYSHKHKGTRPTGYWLSPKMKFGEFNWSLDIWLKFPGDRLEGARNYRSDLDRLDNRSRLAVLFLKSELNDKGIYGIDKEFTSVDVYEGVLSGNVRTIEDLRKFKRVQ